MSTNSLALFRQTFPQVALFSYVNGLNKALAECRTCLDIGCGGGSPIRLLNFEYSVGVEGHARTLVEARRNYTHTEYCLARAQDIGKHFTEGQFDCCVALDLIEHLTKEAGDQLIRDMERIASKKVVLFTPNGFLPQRGADGDLQAHRSGWDAAGMSARGYQVVGMLGHKALRGEQHQHRFRPQFLSGLISQLSHYAYTRSHPTHAAALLCIKDVQRDRKA